MTFRPKVMTTSGSGAELDRVFIIDGYVDEPTCLGVPPYISIYPRYMAGAIWSHDSTTEVRYQTIDQVRTNVEEAQAQWASAGCLILVAGMIVPGKYIGGTPISVRETRRFFSDSSLIDIPKLLVGPWARHGCGLEGGKIALSPKVLSPPFDYIVQGNPGIVIGELAHSKWRFSSVDMSRRNDGTEPIAEYAERGSCIVTQHPGYQRGHIICEIETYRGCPRYLTGGCSFCVEPSYGEPKQRQVRNVINEVKSLYEQGIRAFRIGLQADLFTFGSKEMGQEEFPTPNPSVIEALFSGIRKVAPHLDVLHIDNVNPGTLARHPEESREVARAIIKYHTPGDVAALGIESLDPDVIKKNNLKASEEDALAAVRLLNEVGDQRSSWELPHLLPGINLLYGLPGERTATADYNMGFLETLVEEGLMVRRINIRQVIGYPNTGIEVKKKQGLKRNEFFRHKQMVRERIDSEMIRRVAPKGTILRRTFVERQEGGTYLTRQLGTYPLLCYMTGTADVHGIYDVFVVDHGPRSLSVLPFPLQANAASLSQWKRIPGLGAKRAARIKAYGPLRSKADLEAALEMEIPEWLHNALSFPADANS